MSRHRRGAAAAAALVLGLAPGGCAWSNRDNRPVWNAFEEHLVPEDDTAFVATLPLTFPGGLLAILIDTLVVHPAQVVDDAAGDARDLWDDMRWPEEYYTELAKVPLRGVGTPIVFIGSFFVRSCFDMEPYKRRLSPAELAREREEARSARTAEVRLWLDSLAAGASDRPGHGKTYEWNREWADVGWNDELESAFQEARRSANGEGRLLLYRFARSNGWPPWRADPTMGLRDPDPVVRYRVIQDWPRDERVPSDLQEQLRSDPNEMVRLSARKRFPASP